MPHQIVIRLLRGIELLLPQIHARRSAKGSRCMYEANCKNGEVNKAGFTPETPQ